MLAGFVIVVIRGFLLRPLDVINKRFAALAAGEATAPVEGSDKFCAEMKPLAALLERLRMHRAPGA